MRPYTLLVSSFKVRSEAEEFADQLRPKFSDNSPWILKVDLGKKGTRYRVLVGQFRKPSEAAKSKAILKRLKIKPLTRKWTRWVK